MKIALFGATGALGLEVAKSAIASGHSVRALVRRPEAFPEDLKGSVELVQGDALNQADVDKAVKGQDVVVVSLGHKPILTTCSEAQPIIDKAAVASNVKRVVAVTSMGVGDSKNDLTMMTSFFCNFIIPMQISDKDKQEEILKKDLNDTTTDWVIVRPGGLGNGQATGKYTVAEKGIGSGFVQRADVASFIIKECLSGEKWSRKAATIVG